MLDSGRGQMDTEPEWRVEMNPPQVLEVKLSNGINRNAVRPNRKWQLQDGGLHTGSTYILACRHDRNTISKAEGFMYVLRSSYPLGQSRTLHDPTGSGNAKMAVSKPEVSISRPVSMVETQV